MSGFGKIAFAARSAKLTWGETWSRWVHLQARAPREGDVILGVVAGRPAHVAANMLCSAFLKTTADTLLLVDDDNLVTAETVNALRDDEECHPYAGVGALYTMRNGCPLVMKWQGDGAQNVLTEPGLYTFAQDIPKDSVVEVDAMGLGCVLIRRHAIQDVSDNYNLGRLDRGLNIDERQWFAYPVGYPGTEDVWFFRMARGLGLRFAVHTGVQAPHWDGRFLNYEWEEKDGA